MSRYRDGHVYVLASRGGMGPWSFSVMLLLVLPPASLLVAALRNPAAWPTHNLHAQADAPSVVVVALLVCLGAWQALSELQTRLVVATPSHVCIDAVLGPVCLRTIVPMSLVQRAEFERSLFLRVPGRGRVGREFYHDARLRLRRGRTVGLFRSMDTPQSSEAGALVERITRWAGESATTVAHGTLSERPPGAPPASG